MEGLVCAAQGHALSTNAIKAHIYNLPCSPKCRLGNIAEDPSTSSYSYLVQRECCCFPVSLDTAEASWLSFLEAVVDPKFTSLKE